ncbi:CopD family protein [Mycobacterium sp. TNTM28]|uniref:CopD family protein n=1 Tax=[Mycobacterium] fortunisiensis TaxID=2600579 RepID=A0ABS6KGL9_9MYCO|nr:CopD family protein [[Mycobacterium] fortunisiensis]MBU9762680.1 CopD family protein [[Mycobacterium] fortunisiensis]
MAGSAPPAPNLVAVVTEALHWASLSVPVGIGLTIAVLAIPPDRGGVVAEKVRALSVPAAVFVALAALAQYFVAPPGRGDGFAVHVLPLIQLGGALVVALGLVLLHGRSSRRLAGGVVAVAVLTAVLPNIPRSVPSLNGLAHNVSTAGHVIGALVWVGGLVVLSVAGIASSARIADGAAKDLATRDWIQIWERFGVAALYSVGVLIVSGAWLSWIHVGTFGQLFTTAYGRYLAIKLVLVIALLIAGAYNMRILIPKILAARADGETGHAFHLAAKHFPRVVLAEAVVAIGILVVVPFLRGSARTEAGWPGARSFDLTVFGTGVLLTALVAFALWAGTRTPDRS